MIRPRTLARRVAMQYIFMCDQSGDWESHFVGEFLLEHCEFADGRTFAADLISAVKLNHEKIDGILAACADNWRLERIAAVERNILRVACAELLRKSAPDKVIINEAVSMAKKFGAKDSSKFVNGVLGKALKQIRESDDA